MLEKSELTLSTSSSKRSHSDITPRPNPLALDGLGSNKRSCKISTSSSSTTIPRDVVYLAKHGRDLLFLQIEKEHFLQKLSPHARQHYENLFPPNGKVTFPLYRMGKIKLINTYDIIHFVYKTEIKKNQRNLIKHLSFPQKICCYDETPERDKALLENAGYFKTNNAGSPPSYLNLGVPDLPAYFSRHEPALAAFLFYILKSPPSLLASYERTNFPKATIAAPPKSPKQLILSTSTPPPMRLSVSSTQTSAPSTPNPLISQSSPSSIPLPIPVPTTTANSPEQEVARSLKPFFLKDDFHRQIRHIAQSNMLCIMPKRAMSEDEIEHYPVLLERCRNEWKLLAQQYPVSTFCLVQLLKYVAIPVDSQTSIFPRPVNDVERYYFTLLQGLLFTQFYFLALDKKEQDEIDVPDYFSPSYFNS